MENRYLYRGKRIDNGEWVKGALLLHDSDAATILNQHPADGSIQGFEVEQSTICQCTGLRDKNGKMIWENDIVTGWFDDKIINGYIMYGSNATFFIERKGLYGIHLDNSEDWLEVIGNIFDNPELLKGAENGTE